MIFTGSFLLIAAASWTRAGPSYAALLVAAIAIGIGECFHTTALMPLVADMAPAALRGRYMATMSLSWWIGLALAPTVGTRLLAVSAAVALLPAAGLALSAGVCRRRSAALPGRCPPALRGHGDRDRGGQRPVEIVMAACPGCRAVTVPVTGFTDATEGSDDDQTCEAGSVIGTLMAG